MTMKSKFVTGSGQAVRPGPSTSREIAAEYAALKFGTAREIGDGAARLFESTECADRHAPITLPSLTSSVRTAYRL